MSRQIKDIKDFNTGLLVYPRTHIDAVVGLEQIQGKKEVVYEGGLSSYTITAMRPNVIYWLLEISDITIDSFEDPLQDNNSYDIFTAVIFLGTIGSNQSISLTLPDYVFWANGEMPDLTQGNFELSISRTSDGEFSIYNAVLTPFKTIA